MRLPREGCSGAARASCRRRDCHYRRHLFCGPENEIGGQLLSRFSGAVERGCFLFLSYQAGAMARRPHRCHAGGAHLRTCQISPSRAGKRFRALNIAALIGWSMLALIALVRDLDPGPWVTVRIADHRALFLRRWSDRSCAPSSIAASLGWVSGRAVQPLEVETARVRRYWRSASPPQPCGDRAGDARVVRPATPMATLATPSTAKTTLAHKGEGRRTSCIALVAVLLERKPL